ncbi:helix-turn-helix domain-containing protein [Lentzea sp. NBC_00516]|nr:helix-turn-helix domain-containing protein [Lentzea sp. NBC_00516]
MQDRVDVARLRAALDAERRTREISWRQLAQQAGISPSLLSRMQNGSKPDIESFAALVQWLKVPAENFMTNAVTESGRGNAKEGEAGFEAKFALLLRSDGEFTPEDQTHLQSLVESTAKYLRERRSSK